MWIKEFFIRYNLNWWNYFSFWLFYYLRSQRFRDFTWHQKIKEQKLKDLILRKKNQPLIATWRAPMFWRIRFWNIIIASTYRKKSLKCPVILGVRALGNSIWTINLMHLDIKNPWNRSLHRDKGEIYRLSLRPEEDWTTLENNSPRILSLMMTLKNRRKTIWVLKINWESKMDRFQQQRMEKKRIIWMEKKNKNKRSQLMRPK